MSDAQDDNQTDNRRPPEPDDRPEETVHLSGPGSNGLATTMGSSDAAAEPMSAWLGRYRIIEEVGRGGQAAVYLARDEQLGRDVALKVLQVGAQAPQVVKRFQREAALVSRLDDPGICAVFDGGVNEGRAYIAMQFLRGPNLKDWLKQELATSGTAGATSAGPTLKLARSGSTQRRGLERVLDVIEKVARSLHAAHEAGVVHRDIKPANIMMTEGDRPVIVDFGLAGATDQQLETLTISGDLFGTPLYMSPEQVRGERMDARTDVYSLGVVLYEALTGKRPHSAATREGLYRAILEENACSLRSHRSDLSRDLEVIVTTAMEKDQRRRYQSAADLADDLGRLRRHEVIQAKPVPAWFRFWRLCQRNRLASSLLALLFVLLATGVVVTMNKNRELDRRRERSEQATYRAQIAAANAALQSLDASLLQQTLASVAPARRGWEWRHLQSLIPRPLASLNVGHGSRFAVPVLQDDRLLWIGDAGRWLSLLDIEKGEIVRRLDSQIAFTRFCPAPDGESILISTRAGACLIDARTAEPLWPAPVVGRITGPASFSPSGREIVVRAESTHIVDAETGALLRELPANSNKRSTVQFITDDRLAELVNPLETQGGSFLELRDATDGRLIETFSELGIGLRLEIDQRRGRMLTSSSMVPPRIAARGMSSLGGTATIIDAREARLILDRGFLPAVNCILDADTLACLGPGYIEKRELQTGKFETHQAIFSADGSSIIAGCNGSRIVVYDRAGEVRIWPSRTTQQPWIGPAGSGWDSDLDEHGMRNAGTNWGQVHVTDAHDGRFLWQRNVAHRSLRAIGFSPDGSKLALATEKGEFHLFDAATGEALSTTRQPPRGEYDLRKLTWTRDGKEIIAATSAGLIVGWLPGAEKTRDIARLDRKLLCLAPSADGERLFVGLGPKGDARSGGGIALLSLEDGRLLDMVEVVAPVTALDEHANRANGRSDQSSRLFVGDDTGALAIHHGDTLEFQEWLPKADSAILALDWANEIERLLVGTQSGLILVDVTTDAAVMKFKSNFVDDLHYLADRDAIVFATRGVGGAFGLLETKRDRALDDRRYWHTTVTRVALGLRDEHAVLAEAIASLPSYGIDPELEQAVRDQLQRCEESASWFNSDAWTAAVTRGLSHEEYMRALQVVEIANKHLPGTWSLINTMSQVLYRCGRYEDCLASIEKGLPDYRKWGREGIHSHDRLLRAMSLAQLGRMDEARSELLQSLADWDGKDEIALRREALELIGIPKESVPESLRPNH